MEFRNCDSNTEKVKLHESVRKSMAEIQKMDQSRLALVSVSKNPYKKSIFLRPREGK